MTNNDFRQLTAFARQDGLFMGILWIIALACFIAGFKSQLLMLLCMGLAIFTPFFAYKRLKAFRDYVLEGNISFVKAWAYCILIFFYGSLILAAVVFAYFAFLDNGYIYEQVNRVYSQPEMKPALQQIGMTVKDIMTLYSAYRPIDFAMQSITSNITMGILLSLPIAMLSKRNTIINR